MIAIDTNVLVRYFAQDDATQSARAGEFLEHELSPDQPGFVASVVLVELIWVLDGIYAVPTAGIIQIIERLLNARTLVVEHSDAVERALHLAHGDLADALIHEIGNLAGCAKTVTFDKKFARLAGVELL